MDLEKAAIEIARKSVWYIEADIRAESSRQGSAVLVALKHRMTGHRRNYLLTCLHVVCGVKPIGEAIRYSHPEEIRCWPPESSYSKIDKSNCYIAHVSKVRPLPEGDTKHFTEYDDWVLLEVDDPEFRVIKASTVWAEKNAIPKEGLFIVGYPDGIEGFRTLNKDRYVSNTPSLSLNISQGVDHYAFKVDTLNTKHGMSGGGCYSQDGILIGLHREGKDRSMKRVEIRADRIADELLEKDLQPDQKLPLNSESQTVVQWISSTEAVGRYHREIEAACTRLNCRLVDQHDPSAVDVALVVIVQPESMTPEATATKLEQQLGRIDLVKIPVFAFIHESLFLVDTAETNVQMTSDRFEGLLNRIHSSAKTNYFASVEDLRQAVVSALSQYHPRAQPDLVGKIPFPPAPYEAYPYTLMETSRLVGRDDLLRRLDSWYSDRTVDTDHESPKPIFVVQAVGGMGKSAASWTWFRNGVPHRDALLQGRIWWSFYHADAHFDKFVAKALAYISTRSDHEVEQMSFREQQKELTERLRNGRYLIVLDGFERELNAYSATESLRRRGTHTEEYSDDAVANGWHCSTADPRLGQFLFEFTQGPCESKFLITTRLFPQSLSTRAGLPRPEVEKHELRGMNDEETLIFWRSLGGRGSDEHILQVTRRFRHHPLLIGSLVQVVVKNRWAAGDIDAWLRKRGDTSVYANDDATRHVAVAILDAFPDGGRILHIIAAFHTPIPWSLLVALLVSPDGPAKDTGTLDRQLSLLENHGLVGWERSSNTYDMHPVIRSSVWSVLPDQEKLKLFQSLEARLGELRFDVEQGTGQAAALIQRFYCLASLSRYDEAYLFFRDQCQSVTWKQSNFRLLTDMLELLFPRGVSEQPAVALEHRLELVNYLASGYCHSGRPSIAAELFAALLEQDDIQQAIRSLVFGNLSISLHFTGRLREAYVAALTSLKESRNFTLDSSNPTPDESRALGLLASVQRTMGSCEMELIVKRLSWLGTVAGLEETEFNRVVHPLLLEYALDAENASVSKEIDTAIENAVLESGDSPKSTLFFGSQVQSSSELNSLCTRLIHGRVLLIGGEYDKAERVLANVLLAARDLSLREIEIQAVIGFARIELQRAKATQKKFPPLRWISQIVTFVRRLPIKVRVGFQSNEDSLLSVLYLCEQGPFPLLAADALNLLAQFRIERGDAEGAVWAARKAFEHSWCDGPPFSFVRGLTEARRTLRSLGANPPELEPYDSSKYEPIPDVQINPGFVLFGLSQQYCGVFADSIVRADAARSTQLSEGVSDLDGGRAIEKSVSNATIPLQEVKQAKDLAKQDEAKNSDRSRRDSWRKLVLRFIHVGVPACSLLIVCIACLFRISWSYPVFLSWIVSFWGTAVYGLMILKASAAIKATAKLGAAVQRLTGVRQAPEIWAQDHRDRYSQQTEYAALNIQMIISNNLPFRLVLLNLPIFGVGLMLAFDRINLIPEFICVTVTVYLVLTVWQLRVLKRTLENTPQHSKEESDLAEDISLIDPSHYWRFLD